MKYKTVVLKYNHRAEKMAANEYAGKGWKLVTFSITLAAKAILVFEVPEAEQ